MKLDRIQVGFTNLVSTTHRNIETVSSGQHSFMLCGNSLQKLSLFTGVLVVAAIAAYAFKKYYDPINCNYGNTEQEHIAAFNHYKNDAENGQSEAQFCLAGMYREGLGTEQSYRKAIEWYGRAAEQGSLDAKKTLCYGIDLFHNSNLTNHEFKKLYELANSYWSSSCKCLCIGPEAINNPKLYEQWQQAKASS